LNLELSPRDHPDCPLVSICHSLCGEVAVPARRQPMPITAIGITELFFVPSELLVCPEAFKCACVVRVIVCKDVGARIS
jgi:hypothetical protein